MDNQEIERRLDELEKIYLEAQSNLIKIVNASDTYTPSEKSAILSKVQSQLSDLSSTVRSKVGYDLRSSYRSGKHDAVSLLRDVGETVKYSFNQIDIEAIKAIQDETFAMVSDSIAGVNRSITKILADATNSRVKAKFIEGRLSGETLQQISDRVAGAMKEGFISLIDKSGREWDIARYSTMLVRTKMVQSANDGMMNQLSSFGYEFVQMTKHGGACKLCVPWEGQVLAISRAGVGKIPECNATVDDAKAGGAFHPNCYSDDTEVYTNNGWKFIKNVDKDKIMSINPESQIMEWVDYSHKISYRNNEKMIHLFGKSFDLLVTPDHNLYIGTRTHRNNKQILKWELTPAADAIKKTHKQIRIPKWVGIDIESPIKRLNIKDFAFLLGAYLSEGNVDNNKVCISQSENRKKRFEKRLLKIGFYYNKNRFVITDREIARYFEKFGKSWNKYIPDFFMSAKSEVLSEFLYAFMLGDGSKRTRQNKEIESTEISYFTSSERLAGQIGELILKTGHYPSFTKPPEPKICSFTNGIYKQKHTCWVIRQNNSNNSYYNISNSCKHRGLHAEYVDYNGRVYCLELEKNHIMLVRRNGKISWSGNCKHRLVPYHPRFARLSDKWAKTMYR